ncbi:SDR family NAD(P)-dependent oxidoreductase [Streptomyces sp. NPDC049744]|uniref:SDR family NAD(P)-dependent oxidoreductase n=1 Tax=Streptomyces sp. NPDC049744 TaxID=3154359 RepID=UPI0034486EF3
MQELSRLSGTTALVTGASSGIGAEFARRLAQRGTDLVIVARSGDKLEELASSLRSAYGVRVLTEKLDLSDPEAPREMFERTVEHGIEVGFLVNSAGGGAGGPVAQADPMAIAAMVNLNAQAVIDSTIRFLPGMVSRGSGTIVNIASVSAFQPTLYLAAYAASKAMVQSFTQTVAAEVAESGVRVLAVHPGVTVSGQKSEDILPEIARLCGVRQPEQVVTTAFRALGSRKLSVVDGRRYSMYAAVAQRVPNRMNIALSRRFTRTLRSLIGV